MQPSSSHDSQKDVLQAITACAGSYNATTLARYSITLWDSLKYEIINEQDEDLANEALSALRMLAAQLSKSEASTEPTSPLAAYIRPIAKECNEHLQEPQHKQARFTGRILQSIGEASPSAFTLITRAVLPQLVVLFDDADTISKQDSSARSLCTAL